MKIVFLIEQNNIGDREGVVLISSSKYLFILCPLVVLSFFNYVNRRQAFNSSNNST